MPEELPWNELKRLILVNYQRASGPRVAKFIDPKNFELNVKVCLQEVGGTLGLLDEIAQQAQLGGWIPIIQQQFWQRVEDRLFLPDDSDGPLPKVFTPGSGQTRERGSHRDAEWGKPKRGGRP